MKRTKNTTKLRDNATQAPKKSGIPPEMLASFRQQMLDGMRAQAQAPARQAVMRELANADKKGYFVLKGSQIAEVEICYTGYEPALRAEIPESGCLIVRLR